MAASSVMQSPARGPRRALVYALCAVAMLTLRVSTQPLSVFSQVGLTAQEIAAVESGTAVAKVLPWGRPSEVYIFGAVRVNGSPAAYLEAARDVAQLAGRPGYLAVGRLAADATVRDLAALSLDPDDLKALKTCREGACDVQLPASAMRKFHESVSGSDPEAAAEANRLSREMLMDVLSAYRTGGNRALGVYQDKAHPALVASQFATMIERTAALPDVLPELRDYLLHYPDAVLPGADEYFYWEKVSFGLKPTIRLNHAVVYHTERDRRRIDVVAIKQLYASHYFHTALDVSVCVAEEATSRSRGFYLLTLKGSEQEGLTGLKGALLRKIVADKSRTSLEAALASIKKTVEGG